MILAALRQGLAEVDPVPSDVTEFAKAAFFWRDIDAELGALDFDSIEEDVPSGVRSVGTSRMISFQAGQWMLDIEYDDVARRLMGAISPEARYSIELHTTGAFFTTQSDESGRFEVANVAPGPLGLVLRVDDGQVVKTPWVVL